MRNPFKSGPPCSECVFWRKSPFSTESGGVLDECAHPDQAYNFCAIERDSGLIFGLLERVFAQRSSCGKRASRFMRLERIELSPEKIVESKPEPWITPVSVTEEPGGPRRASYTTKRDVIDELGDEYEHDMMVVAGHDEAILGTVENAEGYTVVAYSKGGIVEGLVRQGMTLEEALEFFDFNIAGAYVGVGTPVFIDDTHFWRWE